MKRFIVGAAIAVIIPLLAACGGSATSAVAGNTFTVNATDFTGTTSVTIKAGGTVQFVDPSSNGGTHFLVIGQNAQFQSDAQAPADLNTANGLEIDAGQTKTVTFANAGTYHITCTIHPSMNVTVTVNP